MVKIKIDGVEFDVDEKKNLISAAKDVGVDIPYFCYHPKLPVVGMCRMCLIEIEGVPKLQAACNTKIQAGLSIITKSPRVVEGREGTMEFLLANHPLDCPVCDKAGECQLQDNSFGSGKSNSRFEFHKRNVPQEEIGTNLIINHNRCIVCYRCVRFEEQYVGESNLGLFERGYHSIIGLVNNDPIKHNYQGALADICPVGALLNKETLFKSRVWWYNSKKSICTGCSTGCNVYTNVRDNKMFRLMPRENEALDMYFLCDKGRSEINWLNENRLFSYFKKGFPTESKFVVPEIAQKIASSKNVLILGGAKESNENLTEILNVFKSFDHLNFTFEARVSQEQFEDTAQIDFLLTKDFRPNTKGAVSLGMVSDDKNSDSLKQSVTSKFDLIFIINENISFPLPENATKIHLGTNVSDFDKMADFSVPIKTYAEQNGTFMNKNGINQFSEQSLKPLQGLLSSGEFFKEVLKEYSSISRGKAIGNN